MNDTAVTPTEARPSVQNPSPIAGTILMDWGARGHDSGCFARTTLDPSIVVEVDYSGLIVFAGVGETPRRRWWFAGHGSVREGGNG